MFKKIGAEDLYAELNKFYKKELYSLEGVKIILDYYDSVNPDYVMNIPEISELCWEYTHEDFVREYGLKRYRWAEEQCGSIDEDELEDYVEEHMVEFIKHTIKELGERGIHVAPTSNNTYVVIGAC